MRIERGKGWEMRLGDCLDVMRGVVADAVVTDPPYGINDAPLHLGRRAGKRRGGDNAWHSDSHWDASISADWGPMVSSIADVVAWFGHWRKREEVAAIVALPLRCEIVWSKDCHVGPPCPVAMRDERMWVFSRHGLTPTRFETSVWDEPIIPTWQHKKHKNEKPVELMVRLVSWLVAPGAVVCDPFAGSGSTGAACLRLGVQFIGAEREREHFDTACERLAAEEVNSSFLAAKAGQEPLFR